MRAGRRARLACTDGAFSGWAYLCHYALMTAAWFATFLVAYVAVRHAFESSIVFYSGHLTVLAVGALNGGLAVALWRWTGLRRYLARPFLVSLLGCVSVTYLLLGYAFVTTIPTLLDRSISIYLIAAVDRAGAVGMPLEDLNAAFLDGYVDGTFQVEKRVEEQIATDNFEMRDGRVYITPRGRFVQGTNRFLARLFNISERYVRALPGQSAGAGPDPGAAHAGGP